MNINAKQPDGGGGEGRVQVEPGGKLRRIRSDGEGGGKVEDDENEECWV